MEPHSLVGGMGEGSWSCRGLACGLQDQRLMAPPTGSGGREKWFVDGRKKVGNEMVFSPPFPKGTCPVPKSPPSRWAGRYQRDKERAAGRVSHKKYSLPHTTPPEGVQREEPLPSGVLSPISSQEMGPRPGRPRFPAVPTAWVMEQPPPTAKETPACQKIRNLI